ncbi:MAG: MoxR family ATPase [Candidatus Aminicenantes bacterium]|nr:MoxR family ATPase [Candidatus Aminicenantes bacterium]
MAPNAAETLIASIRRVFIGEEATVRLAVTALLARGHLLIEDVPGIGKTLLGIALARSIDASFKRIQFTNDLLPSDILGLSIYDAKTGAFDFKPGPIFNQIILADEINRTTPKTQSALLEAMSDLQVSVDGATRPLPLPFMIIATQNPIEYHGTFPLPEAQLDRFLLRLKIGYPTRRDETEIIRGTDYYERAQRLDPVLSAAEILSLQERVGSVRIDPSLLGYILDLVRATRDDHRVKLGASPRGALLLRRASQAYALTHGREHLLPEDIQTVAVPVLAHRIIIDSQSYGLVRIHESDAEIEEVLRRVPVPV